MPLVPASLPPAAPYCTVLQPCPQRSLGSNVRSLLGYLIQRRHCTAAESLWWCSVVPILIQHMCKTPRTMPPADDSVSLVAESDWVRVPSREQTITHYIRLSILQCGLSGNEDWSELPQTRKEARTTRLKSPWEVTMRVWHEVLQKLIPFFLCSARWGWGY